MKSKMNAVTVFSGIGIDEYYLKEIGINVVVANELVKSRATAYEEIYPDVTMVNGDITLDSVKNEFLTECEGKHIGLIIATPPCQGLSMAGLNKTDQLLLNDDRNYLVLSALNLFDKLKSEYLIIENVPRFERMIYPYDKEYISLEELLVKKYGDEYNVDKHVMNAADYGVPQVRQRIVYRVWKKDKMWPLPEKSNEIVTLKSAIGDLPSLESGQDSGLKNHFARKHPQNHIDCMKHTPEGKSAFINDIYYPKKNDGTAIKGFPNTYKRMRWDYPAPTITMRNEIISSQENVHPGRLLPNGLWSDARVLTLRELLIVSSLPADMDKPLCLSETSFRQLIGEGIPPLLLKKILYEIEDLHE